MDQEQRSDEGADNPDDPNGTGQQEPGKEQQPQQEPGGGFPAGTTEDAEGKQVLQEKPPQQ